MTNRLRALAGAATSLLAIAAAAMVLQARDRRHPSSATTERLLYLSSGATADRLFLSFDTLAADIYWIRAIQHFGRDRKAAPGPGRFELLKPLLDLTTTLDPYFNIAYRFGAIFLSIQPPNGPGQPDEAIALLEKGLARNPTRWQYAHDIAFIHYWYGADFTKAAEWFERASKMPRAPEWIKPMVPIMRAKGGDRAGARRMLAELMQADQPYIRQAAERGLMQVRALDALDELQALVDRYAGMTGQFPLDWADLMRVGLIRGVPADDSGVPFAIDGAIRRVTLSPSSRLGPLPQALVRR